MLEPSQWGRLKTVAIYLCGLRPTRYRLPSTVLRPCSLDQSLCRSKAPSKRASSVPKQVNGKDALCVILNLLMSCISGYGRGLWTLIKLQMVLCPLWPSLCKADFVISALWTLGLSQHYLIWITVGAFLGPTIFLFLTNRWSGEW